METKHTKGNWIIRGGYIGIYGTETIIAEINDFKIPNEQFEANAKLIVAAPEMLEALNESLRALQSANIILNGRFNFEESQVLKAIKKATE